MKIEPYSHSGTWVEALQIFLYAELILKKKDISAVKIWDYPAFELTDKIVNDFNVWQTEIPSVNNRIQDWHQINTDQVIQFKKEFGTTFKSKVEIWSDRIKTGYYKEKLQASFEFENYLANLIKQKYGLDLGQFNTANGQYVEGENMLGIEIKLDMMYKKTGNLYIEYGEKSRSENTKFIKSGILKDDKSKYFLIGDYDKFWIFRKSRLQEILEEEQENEEAHKKSQRAIRFVQITTSTGYLFPIRNAEIEALSLDDVVREITGS